ncbi:uncharacterized protein SOCG_06206 [Schizosaccharomyces octosporus yFS286]|uniref:Uncharacterized protein n=1 Tax=Schizosaccharomyces octosporus (strain yFS286) TaxID=483514 RepID=S9PVM5_SCHOY|nr:uncharacterized protein SOCG_06206 [Schizosaccharomyces octosporus yFS286]EPX72032.1 hypothetical protein SOCG_06206 [Schizosaccharomyces octosporus yFS286]
MFQPQIVYDYRHPKDDSYEKVSQEVAHYNSKMFISCCSLICICLINILLSITLKYHKQPNLLILFYFTSYVSWLAAYIYIYFKNRPFRLPRKEKETDESRKQSSNQERNDPSDSEGSQKLPNYTEILEE